MSKYLANRKGRIADLLHDRRWAIPFVIGAILPDLIDKPIGYVFFAEVFGNGRIFLHSLLVFSVTLTIGRIIWKRWDDPSGLALALGILSHQVLDVMKEAPKTRVFSGTRSSSGAWKMPRRGDSPHSRDQRHRPFY